MKDNTNISRPSKGMVRDYHESLLNEELYTFARNANSEEFDGNGVLLQNEPSNLLCTRFKEDYFVVGHEKDLTNDDDYFLLVKLEKNEDGFYTSKTLISEIGVIHNESNNLLETDSIQNTGDICIPLGQKLEESDIIETCNYKTLISDECADEENKFNFSINHPFKDGNVIIKDEKCGKTLYMTDFYNPSRYIILSDLERYKYKSNNECEEKELICPECDQEDYIKCPNMDMMRIFNRYKEPTLTVVTISNGGSLPQGSYEIMVAPSDSEGNPVGDYSSKTNPIKIFDNYDLTQSWDSQDRNTGQAIKLTLDKLDTRYSYYKVAVLFKSALGSHKAGTTTNVYEEGVHPVSDKNIVIQNLNNYKPLDLSGVLVPKTVYERTEMIAAENGYLLHAGLKAKEEINLQPIFNLMGAFLEWETVLADEDLYKDGVNVSKYSSYMRDEIYTFSGRLKFGGGYKTKNFIFPNRPPQPYDEEIINNKTKDSLDKIYDCQSTDRDKRWQIYSTAKYEGLSDPDLTIDGVKEVEKEDIYRCLSNDVATLNDEIFNIPNDFEYFSDFEDFVVENLEELTTVGTNLYNNFKSIADILNDKDIGGYCNILEYEDVDEDGNVVIKQKTTYDNCDKDSLERLPDETKVFIRDIEGIKENKDIKPLNEYKLGDSRADVYLVEDTEISGYVKKSTKEIENFTDCDNDIFKRTVSPNTNPGIAKELKYSKSRYELGEFLKFKPKYMEAPGLIVDYFYSDVPTDAYYDKFFYSPTLSNTALYYKVKLEDYEDIIISLSKAGEFKQKPGLFMFDDSENRYFRVSFYDTDSLGELIFKKSFIYHESDGFIYEMSDSEKQGYDGEYLTIAVDTPIVRRDECEMTLWATSTPPLAPQIQLRKREYKNYRIEVDKITFDKEVAYKMRCKFLVYPDSKCEAYPDKYGSMGLYESEETYPCNKELFDSSSIKVKQELLDGLNPEYRRKFDLYFTDTLKDGYYSIKNGDLTDEKIRHFRFPDNTVAPFMSTSNMFSFVNSKIYPIGVRLRKEVIDFFLDVALDNGLLSQEDRDNVYSLEIFRGDRSLNKTVIAKGLGYDMFNYVDDNGKNIFYSNYPYNDLGEDTLFSRDESRKSNIPHPYTDSNNRFTFHSPDTHFYNPNLDFEMGFEGYQFGNSKGKFLPVESHPKWTIIGKRAYQLANLLAATETTIETLTTTTDFTVKAASAYQVGTTTNVVGSAMATVALAEIIALLADTVFILGKNRLSWLKIIKDLGTPQQFASYYSSVGYYNQLKIDDYNDGTGNNVAYRGLSKREYLKPSILESVESLDDSDNLESITINNYQRESSVYLKLNSYLDYGSFYKYYDNGDINRYESSRFKSSDYNDGNYGVDTIKRVASPYMSLKRYDTRLYGTIYDIKWIKAGEIRFDEDDDLNEKPIFGGDTYISRFSLIRKMPMFYQTAIGLADNTPFAYSKLSNIGYTKYYVDFETIFDTSLKDALFPEFRSEIKLDPKGENKKMYAEPPAKFYLFYYGIPTFLVESSINTNFRIATEDKKDAFYPQVSDYGLLTSEEFRGIDYDNTYIYNPIYSNQDTPLYTQLLPDTYSEELYKCMYDSPNGVIYSTQDNSETRLTDDWLHYKPFDKYEFKSSSGKLIDLRGIESGMIFGRFENRTVLFNAVDTLRERLTDKNYALGSGGMFSTRPMESKMTELGFAGTQHKEMVMCEYGNFWVDAMRGQVFQSNVDAKMPSTEITQGLRNWFKEHLPFKILRGGIENLTALDLDNKYKSLGISMGWDSRFRRLFITKKDYIVLDNYKNFITFAEGSFYYEGKEISLKDETYFKDVSFTIAYSPIYKNWVSYYDFKPDFYVGHNNFFQTGNNFSYDETEKGLWSHLKTNKSYCVFYGKYYGWEIEVPLKEEITTKVLQNIEYWIDSRRYHNEYDFAELRDKGFDRAVIYNNSMNSGYLNMVTKEKNNLYQELNYPKHGKVSTDILVTQQDKYFNINTFYNKVIKENTNVPIWFNDKNSIYKVLNENAFVKQPIWEDRLRGDFFLLRLESNKDSRLKQIFKFNTGDVKNYR